MRLVRPFGKYLAPGAPVPADLLVADAKLLGLVNGTDGGTWAPTNPIKIGGAGLRIQNDIAFSVAKTRRVRYSALEIVSYWQNLGLGETIHWGPNYDDGSAVSRADFSVFYIPLPILHDAATLSNVNVYFKVPAAKQALPIAGPPFGYVGNGCPQLFLFRWNPSWSQHDGGVHVITDAPLTAFGVYNQFTAPTSLASYINGGVPNVVTCVPTQNNVIDRGQYHYTLIYQDDNVPGSSIYDRNSVLGVELTYTSITSMRMP